MKLFLIIHLIMWAIFTTVVVLGGSVWSGFTDSYIGMIMPFVILYSHIEVLPFSAFAFLLIYFIKSNVSVSIEKKNGKS